MAGLIAALASTPVDRAKTLLMTSKEAYGSVFSCLAHIARTRGLAGLYQVQSPHDLSPRSLPTTSPHDLYSICA